MFDIYNIFTNELEYKKYLHTLKWINKIKCPYCNSFSNTILQDKFIYHCNFCNSNHSLTVNTIMHNTKIDLRKWLQAIYIFTFTNKISYRKLSFELEINKNTSYLILNKLYFLHTYYRLEIAKIIGLKATDIEILSRILLIQLMKGKYNNDK